MNDLRDELEWAVREYAVATEHLIEVMDRAAREAGEEVVPIHVKGALSLLTDAINGDWNES